DAGRAVGGRAHVVAVEVTDAVFGRVGLEAGAQLGGDAALAEDLERAGGELIGDQDRWHSILDTGKNDSPQRHKDAKRTRVRLRSSPHIMQRFAARAKPARELAWASCPAPQSRSLGPFASSCLCR